jgi:TPR repeat protein
MHKLRFVALIAVFLQAIIPLAARADDSADCFGPIGTEAARAIDACGRLSDQGNAQAQNKLGVIYRWGWGVNADPSLRRR